MRRNNCYKDGLLLLKHTVKVLSGSRRTAKRHDGHNRLVIARLPTYSNLMAALSEAEPGWGATVLDGFQGKPQVRTVVGVLRSLKDADLALSVVQWAGSREGFKHSTETCNAVLEVFVRTERHGEAWRLLKDEKLKSKFKPDRETCRLLVEGLCRAGQAEQALEVLVKLEVKHRLWVLVLHSLCKAGKFLEQLETVSRAAGNNRTGILAWLCKTGSLNYAVTWLERGIADGHTFDVLSYNLLVDGLCKSSRVEEACRIFQKMLRPEPDLFTYTALVDGLIKEARLDEGQLVFRKMLLQGCAPDTVSCGSLIHGLCKESRLKEAVDLFWRFEEGGIDMDALVYNALILAHCRLEQIETGVEIFHYMKSRGCQPDVVTYNMLVDGLCKSGRVLQAHYYLQHMIKVGCEPTIYTFNGLLRGLCRTDDINDGLQLLERIVRMGNEPGAVSRNLVMDGLCRRGRVEEAIRMFSSLLESRSCCKPTVVSYNVVINGLCKAGRVSEACKLFDGMLADGTCRPNVVTYNTLIDGLCKAMRMEEARAYFRLMKEGGMRSGRGTEDGGQPLSVEEPGEGMLGCQELSGRRPAVVRCAMEQRGRSGPNAEQEETFGEWGKISTSHKVEQAERDEQLKRQENGRTAAAEQENPAELVAPNFITYTVLIHGLCRASSWDEASSLLREMHSAGHTPSAVLYTAIIDGRCRDGRIMEARQLFEQMVKGDESGEASAAQLLNALLKWLRPDEARMYLEDLRPKDSDAA